MSERGYEGPRFTEAKRRILERGSESCPKCAASAVEILAIRLAAERGHEWGDLTPLERAHYHREAEHRLAQGR